MKKILTVLLSTALIACLPATVFADENEQTLTSNADTQQASGTIALEAKKVSSYSVLLPTKLDVSQNETTFNIYAKGDVDGAKMLVFEEADGDHYIKDDAKLKTDKKLTVTCSGSIKGSDIKVDQFDKAKGTTMKIVHDAIDAGTWSGELPIVISLQNITA